MEHQLNKNVLFIVFQPAYDRIKKKELYKAMLELEI